MAHRLARPTAYRLNIPHAAIPPDRILPGIADINDVPGLLQRLSSATFAGFRVDFADLEAVGGFESLLPHIPNRANLELEFDGGNVRIPLNDRNKAQILGIADYVTGNALSEQMGSNIQDIYLGLVANPVFTIRLVEIDTRNPNSDYHLWPAALRGRAHVNPRTLQVPAPIRNRHRQHGANMFEWLRHEFTSLGLNWQHYGIMTTDSLDPSPCLYRALATQGMDVKRLDKLKTLLVSTRVSRQALTAICLKLEIIIGLNTTANNWTNTTKKTKVTNVTYYPESRLSKKKNQEKHPGWPVFMIGLAMGHYFSIDRKTGVTSAALKAIPENWNTMEWLLDDHSTLDAWHPMMDAPGRRGKPAPCTSLELFKALQYPHIKYFFLNDVTVTRDNMDHLLFKRIDKEYTSLQYDHKVDAVPYGERPKKKTYPKKDPEGEEELRPKEWPTFAFDFECTTDGVCHKAFGVAWQYIPSLRDKENFKETGADWDRRIYRAEGVHCAEEMMEYFSNYYNPDLHKGIQLIAHNAGYDKNFIFRLFNKGYPKLIESGTALKLMSGIFYPSRSGYEGKKQETPIKVIDSMSFWGCALSQTVKMFNLDAKKFSKELVPYNLFKKDKIFLPNGELRRLIPMKEFVASIGEQEGGKGKLRELLYAISHRMMGMDKKEYLDEEVKARIEHGMSNVRKWDCLIQESIVHKEPYIDFQEYVMRYCEQDVALLTEAWSKFEDMIYYQLPGRESIGDLKIDLRDSGEGNAFVSINQLANFYLRTRGCFKDTYEFTGVPRDFMQRFVNGGRCMLANNEKQMVTDRKISDFDACSLYPSAMRFGGGFPTGLPEVLEWDHDVIAIPEEWTHFMVMVKVLHFGARRRFPVLSYRDSNGGRVYSDGPDIIGMEIPMDYYTFHDLKEHYPDFRYQILHGYYWTTPRNTTICDVIQEIYDLRRKYKKEKNPVQQVLKLFMNSAYGRTILKPIDKETHFLPNPAVKYTPQEQAQCARDNDKFYMDHFYRIIHMHRMPPGCRFLYRVEVLKDINEHYSAPHIGSDILSMSKRIMNGVMCLAEDIGIRIYYTDTDSMQIEYDKLPLLSAAYQRRYNKTLIGNGMGQFHSDFDLDCLGADAVHKRYKTGLSFDDDKIVSTTFIGCGKKAYYNHLVVPSEERGAAGTGSKTPKVPRHLESFHFRLKGVNVGSVYHYCNTEHITIKQMYQQLYDGKEITFDLTAGKACFKQSKNISVRTLGSFPRRIQFKDKSPNAINRKRALARVACGCPKLAKFI